MVAAKGPRINNCRKWEGEAPAEPNTSFSSATAGGFTERFTGGASGGRRPAVVPGSAGASPYLLDSPTIVDAPVVNIGGSIEHTT